MNAKECGKLLAIMALYDYRKVGAPEVAAWLHVIGDLRFADAEQAVLGHYRECRERIMPADVRSRVKAVREERLRKTPLPDPPAAVADDPVAYTEWLGAERRRIADGPATIRALEAS